MQAHKHRSCSCTSSSQMPQKISPSRISSRSVPSALPQKLSPRQQYKDNTPKATERKSLRSPITELEKKHPFRVAELECQVSLLQDELKKVKDQIGLSKFWENKSLPDEGRQKVTEPQQQTSEQSKSKDDHHAELQEVAHEQDKEKQIELREGKKVEPGLNVVLESKPTEIKLAEPAKIKAILPVEDTDDQLKTFKQVEIHARALVEETRLQLEAPRENLDTKPGLNNTDTMVSNAGSNNMDNSVAVTHQNIGTKEDEWKCKATETAINSKQSEEEKSIAATEELKSPLSSPRERKLEKDLKKLQAEINNLKADLTDKEMELKKASRENELLRMKMRKKEMRREKASEVILADLEAARVAEQGALKKLSIAKEEADESKRSAEKLAEQLEETRAAKQNLEADLRCLRAHSEQWRKAADAAITMLSCTNAVKFMERKGSRKSDFDRVAVKMDSTKCGDVDGDHHHHPKKKNGNVLRRIKILWNNPQE